VATRTAALQAVLSVQYAILTCSMMYRPLRAVERGIQLTSIQVTIPSMRCSS